MQALWLEDQTLTFRDDLPLPEPPPGEALVRTRLAGVCATDLEMVRGYYPFTGVLGHEFVGEVISAPGHPEWVGRRVVGDINTSCHTCPDCLSGRTTHCQNRTVLGLKHRHGVFAGAFTLPIENLHRVPDSVRDEAAVFTEPLAAALEIQQQVHIHPADRVVLIGAGRLGLLIAQTLRLTGCDLQVVVRRPEQSALLARFNLPSVTEDELHERQADVVVEATGSPAGFALAQKVLHPRGVLVLKSTHTDDRPLNLSPLVVSEIQLVGSRCGPFPPALRLLERGLVDPTPLIAAVYPLDDGLAALEHARQPGALKILLRPEN